MRKASLFALICGLCLLLGHAALAEGQGLIDYDIVTEDGVQYRMMEHHAQVVGFDKGYESITLRAEKSGLPVRYSPYEYNADWFIDPPEAKEIIIAEGVTKIESGAFSGCQNLERIVWPSTLETIGEGVFAYCPKITEVRIPEGVRTVGENAFILCESLISVSLPASMDTLGDYAFLSCEKLQTIDVHLDNPNYRSEGRAVYSNDGKRLVLVALGGIEAYDIRPGVTEISHCAFGNAQNMLRLTVPEGVTALESGTFSSLYNLEELTLPASVQRIEENAIWPYRLRSLVISPDNPVYSMVNGALVSGDEMLLFPWKDQTAMNVPPQVRTIAQGIFAGNGTLVSISLPRSITKIESSMFDTCTALERIALPITLEQIGDYAFSDCIMLSSITLPPALRSIGAYAFYNCTSLGEVHIPDTVEEVDPYAFYGCGDDFVIYASENSPGYVAAWTQNILWAEPSGVPSRPWMDSRTERAAVVNNSSADDTLALRASASASAKSQGSFPNGTTVLIISDDGDWAHVRIGSHQGYMPMSSLTLTDRYTKLVRVMWARVDTNNGKGPIYLYSEPLKTSTSRQLEEMTLRVLDSIGVWYKVDAEGEIGYVLAQDLLFAREGYDHEHSYAVVVNPNERDRLHLRKEPNRSSESLGRFFNGTQVEVLEHVDGWTKVRIDGDLVGYMMTDFLVAVYNGGAGSLVGFG